MDDEVINAIKLSNENKVRLEVHMQQYQRDLDELNTKIGGIFSKLDTMSNRWLALSGSIIMILLGSCSWLIVKILQLGVTP